MQTTPPKVLFVLGAGASSDFGYPLGADLKDQLIQRLNPGSSVYRALINSGHTDEKINTFTRELLGAEYDTIDHHIEALGDIETRNIARRAVGYFIRSLENAYTFRNRLPDGEKHWYRIFADHLAKHKDQISSDQFSFITFNYDRSLSYYFQNVLSSRRTAASQLSAFVKWPNIFHVHGHVGPLPWQLEDGETSKAYNQYGANLSDHDLAEHAPDILFPDDERDAGLIMARLAANAKIVVFVGFSFQESNMPQLPFNPTSPPLGQNARRYFSINLAPPPDGMRLEGEHIRHIRGRAHQQMQELLSRVIDKTLLTDVAPEARFKRYSDKATDTQKNEDDNSDDD